MENELNTEIFEIIITDHAYKRAKERLSLTSNAFKKLATKAYHQGISKSDCSGNLAKYVYKLWRSYQVANNIRIFGEYVFLFTGNILITVYQIPNNVKKAAITNGKKKRKVIE